MPACFTPLRYTDAMGSRTKMRSRLNAVHTTNTIRTRVATTFIGASQAHRSSSAPQILSCLCRLLVLLLVVLLLRIDLPERLLVDATCGKAIHRVHCCQHTVVLVVVLVHSIAAHQEDVVDAVGEILQLIEAAVGPEVCRISFGYANHVCVTDCIRIQNADLRNLGDGILLQVVVGHLP